MLQERRVTKGRKKPRRLLGTWLSCVVDVKPDCQEFMAETGDQLLSVSKRIVELQMQK